MSQPKKSSRRHFLSMSNLQAKVKKVLQPLKRRASNGQDTEDVGQGNSKHPRNATSKSPDSLGIASAADACPVPSLASSSSKTAGKGDVSKSVVTIPTSTKGPKAPRQAPRHSLRAAGASSENPIELLDDIQPKHSTKEVGSSARNPIILQDEASPTHATQQELLLGRGTSSSAKMADWALKNTGPPSRMTMKLSNSEAAFYAFCARIMQAKCAVCKTPLGIDANGIWKSNDRQLKTTPRKIHPCIQCPNRKCHKWCCVGGHISLEDPSGYSPLLPRNEVFGGHDTSVVSWCCDDGRRYLCLSLLSGIRAPDATSLGTKTRRRLAKPQPQNGEKIPDNSPIPSGTGYGGPTTRASTKATTTTCQTTLAEPKNWELELLCRALAIALPSWTKERPTDFDNAADTAITAMMTRSPVFTMALDILREDSIEEISSNQRVLSAILELFETATTHSDSATLFYSERVIYPTEEQLPSCLVRQSKAKFSDTTGSVTGMPSPWKLFEKLSRPCFHFLNATRDKVDQVLNDEKELVSLLRRICTAAEQMRYQQEVSDRAKQPLLSTARPLSTGLSFAKNHVGHQMIKKNFSDWHREHAAKALTNQEIRSNFSLLNGFGPTGGVASRAAAARMRSLAAQISSLHEDLPEGIWVRYSDEDLGLMKALITGPSETPYEHGLFEFDIHCTESFPQTPPVVNFRTTGGGRAHFNPNLYPCGKVCLSLLGTWKGHQWEPSKSTVLQVLVSIQAMILTSQPWYNEPGREAPNRHNPVASAQYNRQKELDTVNYALTYWLDERLAPPAKPVAPKAAPTTHPNQNSQFGVTTAPTPSGLLSSQPPFMVDGPPSSQPPFMVDGPPSLFGMPSEYWSFPPPLPLPAPNHTVVPHAVPSGAHTQTMPNTLQGLHFTAACPTPDTAAFIHHTMMPYEDPDQSLVGAISSHSSAAAWTSMSSMQKLNHMMPFPQPLSSTSRPQKTKPAPPAPKKDDVVWGPVLRKYFEAKSAEILVTAKKWEVDALAEEKSMGQAIRTSRLRLEAALSAHGFKTS